MVGNKKRMVIFHDDIITLRIWIHDLFRRYESRNDGYDLIAMAKAAILQQDIERLGKFDCNLPIIRIVQRNFWPFIFFLIYLKVYRLEWSEI